MNTLMRKNKGLTLFETMLVVAISMGVMASGTYLLSKYQKAKFASTVATDVVQVISAIDKRMYLDGYKADKWGSDSYANTADVRKFFNEKLISREAACGKTNGWTPITDKIEGTVEAAKMEKVTLIPCNLWSEKTPWGTSLSIDFTTENNNVNTINLYLKFKDDESFHENIPYVRAALTEMKAKDNQQVAGAHYYTFVDESNKGTPITPLKCVDLQSKCILKASFSSEDTGAEYLQVSGKNSMVNSAISFKPEASQQAVNCLRWKYDTTGNYVSSNVKCGFGIYDTSETETNKRIDLVIDSVTTKGFYLNKNCNKYVYNFSSQSLQLDGNSPCGIYEQDGSVIQVVENINTEKLFASQIKAKDLFISNLDVKEALTVLDTLTATGNVKVDGKTTINQGLTVDRDARFNRNLEIGETLNVKGDTTLEAVAAENIYSATNITSKTFKGDFLDLSITKGINDFCTVGEAGMITGSTQSSGVDFKNILLVCKATTAKPSEFRWRSINGIENQIMAFNTACPPGWKKFSKADGRSLVGTGKYIEGAVTYNYNLGEIGGEALHALTIAEMPSHNHNAPIPGSGSGPRAGIQRTNTDTVWSSNSSIRTTSTGGNKPHENRSPYVAVNWCIYEN